MERTDSEIKRQVLLELVWDTRVSEREVGVQAAAGIVTLTGTVGSWAKKVAAAEAAHRVAGVRDVANDIQVKVPGTAVRTDAEIAAAVRHALEWDILVPDTKIRSTVSDGWVTLAGVVDHWNERDDAERAVRNLAAVIGISNEIEVQPPKVLSGNVRASINDALQRRAAREAKRIAVEVRDGRVCLKGTVRSWAERQAVVGAATGTTGVRGIEDHLRIKPYAG
jgi:osmotically-inducible protein OsmY